MDWAQARKRARAWCCALGLGVCMGSATAATLEQIDSARAQAVAWLISQQQGDGSWRNGKHADIQASMAVLQALAHVGVRGLPSVRGTAWLANTQAHSVDALARQIRVLNTAGINVDALLERLLGWRNRQAAWGTYDRYATAFPDTPLAIGTIRTSARFEEQRERLLRGLCQVLQGQFADGSWTLVPQQGDLVSTPDNGAILATVHNVMELQAFVELGHATQQCAEVDYSLSSAIGAGLNWLFSQRNRPDGGFSEPGTYQEQSTVIDSALVCQLLNQLHSTDPRLTAAQDYLLSVQDANGSWHNDVLATAWAVMSFSAVTMADTDQDGIPNVSEAILGTDPQAADSRRLQAGNGQAIEGVTYSFVFPAQLNEALVVDFPALLGRAYSSWGIAQGTIPANTALGSTGVLTGTPTTSGIYNFHVLATDATSSESRLVAVQVQVGTPPTLTAPAARAVREGEDILLPISANDLDGDVLTYAANGLPPGLNINTASGTIRGTLAQGSAGTYQSTVTVTDGQHTTDVAIAWTVAAVAQAPSLSNPGDLQHREGDSVAIDLQARDANGDALRFSASGLPPGVQVDANGRLVGNIHFNAASRYQVRITADDGQLSTQIAFVWQISNVNRPPSLNPLGIQALYEDDVLRIAVQASDPDADGLQLLSSALPEFMQLEDHGDGSGELTIAPDLTQSGAYSLDIIARDNGVAPLSVRQPLIVMVNDKTNPTTVVRMRTHLGVIETELYGRQTPNTVANFLNYVQSGSYTNSFIHDLVLPGEDATAPRGLLLGGYLKYLPPTLSYVPQTAPVLSEAGLSNRIATLATLPEVTGDRDSATSRWYINLGNNAAALDPLGHTVFGRVIRGWDVVSRIAALPRYNVTNPPNTVSLPRLPVTRQPANDEWWNGLVSLTAVQEVALSAVDYRPLAMPNAPFRAPLPIPIGGTAPYHYQISAGDLPAGVTLNAVTGLLTGMPEASGETTATYRVTDSAGLHADGRIQFKVDAPPVIQPVAAQQHQQGEQVALQVEVQGEAGETLRYAATGLPPGLAINSSSGLISGTTQTPGEFVTQIAVRDASYTVYRHFSWTVEAQSATPGQGGNASTGATATQITPTEQPRDSVQIQRRFQERPYY